MQHAFDGRPRGLRLLGNDGQLAAEQRIEQRGFSGIGTAEDGDVTGAEGIRHRVPSPAFYCDPSVTTLHRQPTFYRPPSARTELSAQRYTRSGRSPMRKFCFVLATAIAIFLTNGLAQQGGPYKVLKTAKVGGEGGWDYIYADSAGRRLYIPRRGNPNTPDVKTRLSIYNLDTLELVSEIEGVGGNGAAVDPKSGHGFTSSKPVSMFDTKTQKLIKTIDVAEAARPDGITFDGFNDRVYVFSHPTKDATVIDSHDGRVLGTIDLGGVPEQGVADGKGMLYVVMQDAQGSVTAVDVKSMKATAHYPLGDKGGCNGLALDVKNQVLFAACARSGAQTTQPAP